MTAPPDPPSFSPPTLTPVLLGLGANVGEPLAQLARAVAALGEVIEIERVSSVYRTEPVGYAEQPDFYNLVVVGRTDRAPEQVLDEILAIERWMGRERTFRNAPRLIDIDLLAYGEVVMETERLVLPHPRMHERGFVLHPLAEAAPEWRHPARMQTARELLEASPERERVLMVGPLPPSP